MKKCLVMFYSLDNNWLSGTKITQGLLECYELEFEVRILKLQNSLNDLSEFKKIIGHTTFDIVSFIDHRLSPSKAMGLFRNAFSESEQKRIQLIFHAFGDVVSRTYDWYHFGKQSEGLNVKIMVSCEIQKKIFLQLSRRDSGIHVFPYLLTREWIRKLQGIKITQAEKPRIGYLGRLSRLKNITQMIAVLSPWLERDEIELVLSGPYDDIDRPTISTGVGYYMREVESLIKRTKNVTYAGVQNTPENVIEFFSTLQGFCTLSTNPSEDFCYAVAEAATAGLPCLVTRWLALVDHSERCDAIISLPVKALEKGTIVASAVPLQAVQLFIDNLRNKERPTIPFDLSFSKNKLSHILSHGSNFMGFMEQELQRLHQKKELPLDTYAP